MNALAKFASSTCPAHFLPSRHVRSGVSPTTGSPLETRPVPRSAANVREIWSEGTASISRPYIRLDRQPEATRRAYAREFGIALDEPMNSAWMATRNAVLATSPLRRMVQPGASCGSC
jgi:hypothetical protein